MSQTLQYELDDAALDAVLQQSTNFIMGTKSIWLLCQGEKVKQFAVCLAGGKNPLWVVYSETGRVVRAFTFRKEIEDRYPQLTWRSHPARWRFLGLAPRKAADRKLQLVTNLGIKLPKEPADASA